jgi:hypothetical protein
MAPRKNERGAAVTAHPLKCRPAARQDSFRDKASLDADQVKTAPAPARRLPTYLGDLSDWLHTLSWWAGDQHGFADRMMVERAIEDYEACLADRELSLDAARSDLQDLEDRFVSLQTKLEKFEKADAA